MKTITLRMNMTPDEARDEWEALPESATKVEREAHWLRFTRLRDAQISGSPTVEVVTYLGKGEEKAERPNGNSQEARASHGTANDKAPAAKPAAAQRSVRTTGRPLAAFVAAVPQAKPAIDAEAIAPRCRRALELAEWDWHGALGEFRAKAGISLPEWAAAVNAKRKKMTPAFLQKFCETLNCSPEWLLTGLGPEWEAGGPTKGQRPEEIKQYTYKKPIRAWNAKPRAAARKREATRKASRGLQTAVAPLKAAVRAAGLGLCDLLRELQRSVSELETAKARVASLTELVREGVAKLTA